MTAKVILVTGATGKQGGSLIDALLKATHPTRSSPISHFVYTSVDRGTNSDTDATNIPHFITEYDIEQHLFFCVAEKSNMAYTVLRPVGFYDNVTADFFCKVFTTSWAVKLPEDKKLQLIATSDNGEFAGQAFLKDQGDVYRNKSMSLAAAALSLEEFQGIFEKKTGEKLPMTYGFVAKMVMGLNKDIGIMYDWFREVGFGASVEECEAIHGGMKGFEEWIETESAWKNARY
ncbi:hypothetical protein CFE70_005257 [Pyrenophora teres f. teres 0-1]